MGVETEEGLSFDRSFLGHRAKLWQWPPPHLFGGFRGTFEKSGPTDCCTQQYSRGFFFFGHYMDQKNTSFIR